jgi:hypothetical protein
MGLKIRWIDKLCVRLLVKMKDETQKRQMVWANVRLQKKWIGWEIIKILDVIKKLIVMGNQILYDWLENKKIIGNFRILKLEKVKNKTGHSVTYKKWWMENYLK